MQEILPDYKNAGASIVALCPQLPEFNGAISQQLDLGFAVLQDRDNSLATGFGLTLETPSDVIKAEQSLGLDLPAQNGNQNWDLPMPARFAIDLSWTIRYASYHVDHRKRNDPADCLDRLRDSVS